MNIELLERIKNHILEEPKRINMYCWVKSVEYDGPLCGTAACIAGWAFLLADKVSLGYVNEEATSLLWLNPDQSVRLFYVDNWPDRFRVLDRVPPGTSAYAQVVARRIEHFIDTEGRE
jgi:hypothetical protein